MSETPSINQVIDDRGAIADLQNDVTSPEDQAYLDEEKRKMLEMRAEVLRKGAGIAMSQGTAMTKNEAANPADNLGAYDGDGRRA